MALYSVQSNILEKIQHSYAMDDHLQQVLTRLQQGQTVGKYSFMDGMVRRKGKLVVGLDKGLKQQLLQWVHDSPFGGHSGRHATLKRLQRLFY